MPMISTRRHTQNSLTQKQKKHHLHRQSHGKVVQKIIEQEDLNLAEGIKDLVESFYFRFPVFVAFAFFPGLAKLRVFTHDTFHRLESHGWEVADVITVVLIHPVQQFVRQAGTRLIQHGNNGLSSGQHSSALFHVQITTAGGNGVYQEVTWII